MFSYEMLVNCENRLPEDFVPPSLAAPDIAFAADPSDEKRFLEVRAARHAKRLFDAAKAEGIFLYGISGYRSYERQEILYQKACCKRMELVTAVLLLETRSATSSCPAVSLNLSQAFSETAEGRWLARHAPLYGFIIRYPKGKEHLTKIPAEPWHIRYVTRSLALCLTLTGQVLEEYYACCER